MRQIVLFVSVLVLFMVCIIHGAEPNFVRTRVFDIDGAGASHDVVSTDYTDGLGRALQSKLQLSTGRARVVSSFFDNAGRPYLTTKPYVDKIANSINLFTPGDFDEINGTLNNSDNYSGFVVGGSAFAYSESEYYDDPLGRVKRAGAPGNDYRLGSGHHTSSWTFGIVLSNTEIKKELPEGAPLVDVVIKGGFIDAFEPGTSTKTNLTDDILDGLYECLLAHPITDADHFLTISRDPDGHYSQALNDLFGKTDSTRSDNGSERIIAGYNYDILGNLLIERAPQGSGGSTIISDSRYEYNTLGQLIKKISPDLFVESMTYDDAGNIESKIVQGMNARYDMFNITYNYDYDELSRLKTIHTPGVYYGTVELIRYFYDNTDEFFIEAKAHGIQTEFFTNLENAQGKLVAEIAYNRAAGRSFYFGGHKPELVVDVYSYDDEGRVKTKFKVIPGLPLQTIDYTYDVHGKMETEEFKCGSTTSMKHYKYDADGNLKAIAHGSAGNVIVTYEYDSHGWLKSKDFSKLTGNNKLSYTYNIRDWLTTLSFNGSKRFSQSIDYTTDKNDNSRGAGRIPVSTQQTYNGNIRFSSLVYNDGSGDKFFDQSYDYDPINRLSTYKTYNESNTENTGFSGDFDYDNAGRFTSKNEGSSNNGAYQYYKNPAGTQATCRLKQAKVGGDIYIYDYKGNMIIDQSKKMYISYDWRNLPIKFDFYNSLPVGSDNTSKIHPDDYGTMIISDNSYHSTDPTNYVDYLDWLRANGTIKLLSSVQMYYDAAGKRVLKVEK